MHFVRSSLIAVVCSYQFVLKGPDFPETIHQTKIMLDELGADKESGNKGFVSDMVVVFKLKEDSPAKKNGYDFREINFSAWTDDEASLNWYKQSQAHKDIVHDYYNAGLTSFSALLGRLKPDPETPLRWEVRCLNCRKMVLGPKVTACPYCAAEMHPMPYI